jgi:hypothetical protein
MHTKYKKNDQKQMNFLKNPLLADLSAKNDDKMHRF